MALAILLWAPQGISHGDTTMLTGHSTFYNGETYDACLGSIAGIMRSRVMWFNDQVLVETYGGRGTFILVTEQGAPDPRDEAVLYSEGVFYDFVDPNGAHWHVEEAFYDTEIEYGGSLLGDPADAIPRFEEHRVYVWFVELAARPIYDEFAGDDPHSYYNFLVLVDTCNMDRKAFDRNVTHSLETGDLNDRNGHPNGATEHDHESFMVDIWVGTRPNVASAGIATPGVSWETAWAQDTTGQETPQTNQQPPSTRELP